MGSLAAPHPLAPLSESEFLQARDVVQAKHGESVLFFKAIYLREPPKDSLTAFLELEHAGTLTSDHPRPPRQASVEYDIVNREKHQFIHAVVDIARAQIISSEEAPPASNPYYTPAEFALFQDACVASDLFKDAMSEFILPQGFTVIIDPWPYGGPDDGDDQPLRMQGLVFARDSSQGNDDANHYAYPIPIIPVMDWASKKIVHVDRLATGGKGDGLGPRPKQDTPRKLFQEGRAADYVPELLDVPLRSDLKPLNVVQPEGASFKIHSDGLLEWQKWRFRLAFTPREGGVLHDVRYDGRSVLYRLSYSELTVPYGDPRSPYHRKQAFDLGDGGVGRAANNLELGCDCLGAIHYLDGLLTAPDGSPQAAKSVVCLHEQDNGILWKHTNFRTNRAVVTRNRELVIQFIVTLANYEYILAYKLDLAGGITVETRATGIMSVVAIDGGKTSDYGNVVAPGILAQNHQHVFAVRIDPAIDSYADTQVVVEESRPAPMDPETNPHGNLYTVARDPVTRSQHVDAEPSLNRVIKLEHRTKLNTSSQRHVSYKLIAPATQLLLADEKSVAARRAPFGKHATWVTGYRDGELWAAGEFTNQSRCESKGVKAMVERGDWFTEGMEEPVGQTSAEAKMSTPVVWSVFGFTHNPRVEDWPVMPVEIHQLHLRPADFFTSNPALDVPSNKNQASVTVPCCDERSVAPGPGSPAEKSPLDHLQGKGVDILPEKIGAHVDLRQAAN